MPKRLSLSEQIRRAIESSSQSHYRICKEAGVDKATLSRFMTGERGLTSQSMDRLADYLGLELCEQNGRAKGR